MLKNSLNNHKNNKMQLLRLLRIHQWIKNFLIFLPIIFVLSNPQKYPFFTIITSSTIQNLFLAFFQFCTLSSAVYIFNDIKDVQSDRLHPTKKFRPIASNQIKINTAIVILIILLFLSFVTPQVLAGSNPNISIILASYLLINIFYTFYLKNIALLDISCIAAGLLLRFVAGTAALLTTNSLLNFLPLFISIFFAALCGALLKRLIEFCHSHNTRKSLAFFTKESLVGLCLLFCTLTILFFALFIGNEFTYNSIKIISTIPMTLLFALLFNDALKGKGEDLSLHLIKNPIYIIIALATGAILII